MPGWLRKRLWVDRFLAAVLAVLAAPVVAVCVWRVRADDGGPPLVRVARTGRNGRTFEMWKIRTMRVDDAGGLAAGWRLTGEGDDRITPVGRRLRGYHLDELPQLFNVMAGDMSLLGPRPEDPAYVDPNDERWRTVLQMPPGMAGITQLIVGDWEQQVIAEGPEGYGRDVVPVKLALDEWYVRNATAFLDLQVLVALAWHLITRQSNSALATRLAKKAAPGKVTLPCASLSAHPTG